MVKCCKNRLRFDEVIATRWWWTFWARYIEISWGVKSLTKSLSWCVCLERVGRAKVVNEMSNVTLLQDSDPLWTMLTLVFSSVIVVPVFMLSCRVSGIFFPFGYLCCVVCNVVPLIVFTYFIVSLCFSLIAVIQFVILHSWLNKLNDAKLK